MNKSSDDWNKLKHLVDLSAENARLQAEVEHIKFWNEQLKAENDLLRKAGDAMEVSLQADFNGCPYEPMIIREVIHRWRSAKEGKQS